MDSTTHTFLAVGVTFLGYVYGKHVGRKKQTQETQELFKQTLEFLYIEYAERLAQVYMFLSRHEKNDDDSNSLDPFDLEDPMVDEIVENITISLRDSVEQGREND